MESTQNVFEWHHANMKVVKDLQHQKRCGDAAFLGLKTRAIIIYFRLHCIFDGTPFSPPRVGGCLPVL
jgi:hypothetical protein